MSLLDRMIDAGLLIDTGVDGLMGRGLVFDAVIDGLGAMITAAGAGDGAERMRFPPGLSRQVFQRSGYMKGFPQFAGTVHCFCGDERDHRALLSCMEEGGDWTADQAATDIVLTPAACYPVYPTLAKRGPLGPEGSLVDVMSYCFRHEPSREPTRLQMFRMREYVRIGTPAQVLAFRDMWQERASGLAAALDLPCELEVANDPFFGRPGKLVAEYQRHQELKFELVIPVNDGAPPTACMSFNYHQDHFGGLFGLAGLDGAVSHTGCVAFGIERLAVALFRHHGFDPATWPAGVRTTLCL